MIAVYVAGPYSNPDPAEVQRNVARAMEAGDALEDAGFRAFIPHLSHFRHAARPRSYEDWMAIDFDWLGRCDALLRLSGGSSGADREITEARIRGIPVFHSVEDVIAYWREAA